MRQWLRTGVRALVALVAAEVLLGAAVLLVGPVLAQDRMLALVAGTVLITLGSGFWLVPALTARHLMAGIALAVLIGMALATGNYGYRRTVHLERWEAACRTWVLHERLTRVEADELRGVACVGTDGAQHYAAPERLLPSGFGTNP